MHKRFLFEPSLTVRLLVTLVDYNPERGLLGLLLTDVVRNFISRLSITGSLGAPYTKGPRGDPLAALFSRVYTPDELSRLPRTIGTLGDCSQQHEATTRPSITRLALQATICVRDLVRLTALSLSGLLSLITSFNLAPMNWLTFCPFPRSGAYAWICSFLSPTSED